MTTIGIRVEFRVTRKRDVRRPVAGLQAVTHANAHRFLIVRLGSLGDVIHGIPVAAALRERFPSARIDWLVDPRYVELLEHVRASTR